MKKNLTKVLAAAMSLSMLTACGGNTTAATTAAATEAATTEAAE